MSNCRNVLTEDEFSEYYHFQETSNDIDNTDDLEKELAEIVIDAPPVILAEVC